MTMSILELLKWSKLLNVDVKSTQLYCLQLNYYLDTSIINKTRCVSYENLKSCKGNIKKLHIHKSDMKYRYAIKAVNNWLLLFEKIEEYRKLQKIITESEKKELKQKLKTN